MIMNEMTQFTKFPQKERIDFLEMTLPSPRIRERRVGEAASHQLSSFRISGRFLEMSG